MRTRHVSVTSFDLDQLNLVNVGQLRLAAISRVQLPLYSGLLCWKKPHLITRLFQLLFSLFLKLLSDSMYSWK